jgi:NAD(P)H-hydrate epimerase
MEPMTREQIKALDHCAIEVIGVAGAVLMENAGRNATDAIERMLGDARGKLVAIVAGAGNNGGDGFVIARHLAMRGARVATIVLAEEAQITGDARTNLDILRNLRHEVLHLAPHTLASLADVLKRHDLIVDAIGGTGIRGPLRDDMATAVEQINAAGKPVVAIDIPTGLDCDTGEATGPAVRAKLTVTMAAAKKGFDAPGAREYTGEVQVVDIGVPAELVNEIADKVLRR